MRNAGARLQWSWGVEAEGKTLACPGTFDRKAVIARRGVGSVGVGLGVCACACGCGWSDSNSDYEARNLLVIQESEEVDSGSLIGDSGRWSSA